MSDDAKTGRAVQVSRRHFPALIAGAAVATTLPVRAQSGRSGATIRQAAVDLLSGVGSEVRAAIAFPFSAAERHRWTYVPGRRAGVMLDDMSARERELAMALLAASLSERGYAKAAGVMTLASVLRETRGFGRGSGAYAFAVFGDPAAGGAWGWRVEGHHLSLHFTGFDDAIISATPHCVCADPTEVLEGPHAGLAPLDREDYIGRDLARNLSAEQMDTARLEGAVSNDIRAGPRRAALADRGGISYAELTDETQRHLMLGLAETYLSNLPRELADAQMSRLTGLDRDSLRFQWVGGFEMTDLHYYRLHGPTLAIEYATRERATHVHTIWREPGNDFGRAQLAQAGVETLPPEGA